jgi:hypothetical protein
MAPQSPRRSRYASRLLQTLTHTGSSGDTRCSRRQRCQRRPKHNTYCPGPSQLPVQRQAGQPTLRAGADKQEQPVVHAGIETTALSGRHPQTDTTGTAVMSQHNQSSSKGHWRHLRLPTRGQISTHFQLCRHLFSVSRCQATQETDLNATIDLRTSFTGH